MQLLLPTFVSIARFGTSLQPTAGSKDLSPSADARLRLVVNPRPASTGKGKTAKLSVVSILCIRNVQAKHRRTPQDQFSRTVESAPNANHPCLLLLVGRRSLCSPSKVLVRCESFCHTKSRDDTTERSSFPKKTQRSDSLRCKRLHLCQQKL